MEIERDDRWEERKEEALSGTVITNSIIRCNVLAEERSVEGKG